MDSDVGMTVTGVTDGPRTIVYLHQWPWPVVGMAVYICGTITLYASCLPVERRLPVYYKLSKYSTANLKYMDSKYATANLKYMDTCAIILPHSQLTLLSEC